MRLTWTGEWGLCVPVWPRRTRGWNGRAPVSMQCSSTPQDHTSATAGLHCEAPALTCSSTTR